MVWRSLMEKVEPKDIIRNKRLQVFNDDMKKLQQQNIFQSDSNTVVPEELLLWNRHTQLKEMVADAKARITREKENLQQLTECAASKFSHRNLLRKRVEDAQRRSFLLQSLAEQLRDKRAKLQETRSIADSLCSHDEEIDIEGKLNKCITALTRQAAAAGAKTSVSLASTLNPAASPSVVSTISDHNDEEVIECVARCRGDALYRQLYERRARLLAAIPHSCAGAPLQHAAKVQSVLCHTAALQSFISLETMKNRLHIDRTRKKLAATFIHLNNYISSEECELLITRCERACVEARVEALRSSRQEVANRSGVFATGVQPGGISAHTPGLQAIDNNIESKRDELKRLIISVATVERKTQIVKDSLLSLFNGFHDNAALAGERFGGRPSLLSQYSIATLRQFYEDKREKYRNKVDLSMNLDMSDNCSFNRLTDEGPVFINELKLYLNRFTLEKNRKFVLESGQKIWNFETVNSSLEDLFSKWQKQDMTTSLLCPTLTLKRNCLRLTQDVCRKEELTTKIEALEVVNVSRRVVDITSSTEEEQKILDKIKKRYDDNLQILQRTTKSLDVGMENLQFWSDNNIRRYISDSRNLNGISYSNYEKAYLHSIAY